jgi:hypothetical protein
MADRHPKAPDRESPLVMGPAERMPILDTVKTFSAMNESVVCTVETHDRAGNKRGAIAFGISRHDLPVGFAVYQTIVEAEAIVALLQNAIADAKRIEDGIAPLAPISDAPPVKH